MSDWQPTRARASLAQRSRHTLARALPAAVWVVAALGLVKLAEVTPSAQRVPGVVDSKDCTLLAPVDGRLVTIAVQLHQLVEADAVIARFDDSAVRLRLQQANYELERLRADMAKAQLDLEREARATASEQDMAAAVEHRRLISAVEAAQLAALTTRTEIEETRVRLQGAAVETDRLSALAKQAMIAEPELVKVRTERDALDKRIRELETLCDQQRMVTATCQQRLAEFRPGRLADLPVDTALAPLRWRLKEQETQLERITLDAQALDVRAPMRGHVAALDVNAGEWTRAGSPLARIVDPTPRRILAYVPDTMRAQLATVRTLQVHRTDASLLGDTTLLSISPTVVRLPARLWRDPQREEWGYEIVLAATGAELPGERVQVAPRH